MLALARPRVSLSFAPRGSSAREVRRAVASRFDRAPIASLRHRYRWVTSSLTASARSARAQRRANERHATRVRVRASATEDRAENSRRYRANDSELEGVLGKLVSSLPDGRKESAPESYGARPESKTLKEGRYARGNPVRSGAVTEAAIRGEDFEVVESAMPSLGAAATLAFGFATLFAAYKVVDALNAEPAKTRASFNDVDELLMNYFTYRALRETLAQMQETDLSPGKGEYKWLYNFAASEYKNRGNEFVTKLFAEGRADHAQRILAQRVVLLKRWNGYYVRGRGNERCYTKYEEKNLSLLREHLLCTVNLSDDALVDGRETSETSTDCSLYEKIIKESEDDSMR